MATRTGEEQGGLYAERELTDAAQLCDEEGRLNPAAVGWSRRPLHTCNLRGYWGRKKRWNYWCVTSDRHLFSVTLADIDYLGVAFVYFLDYETGRFTEQTVRALLGRGCALPETAEGDIAFESGAMSLSFSEEPGLTHIQVDSRDFGGAPLSAEMCVQRQAGHETLNVVIPWSRDRFHFTSKQNCLAAAGEVRIGGETFAFESGGTFACLDYGRGVWRYRTSWNWGSFSGTAGGRPVGVNLGGTWTDGTGMTENALLVDGRLSKLSEDVRFEYERSDLMKPWAVETAVSERVSLRFVPFFERAARTDLMLFKSDVHQLIGRFSGTLVPEGGEAVRVAEMVGWVEQHEARW